MTAVPLDQRRWLTIQAATIYASLSDSTLRDFIKSKQLRAYRPRGGRILIDREELDRLVAASVNAPTTRGRHNMEAADAKAS